MSERRGFLKTIRNKSEAATERSRQQQEKSELEERRLLDAATSNLEYAQKILTDSTSLRDYLEQTGGDITLVKRTSPRYIPPPPLYYGLPSVAFLRSRIAIDERGVVVKHELHSRFSDGPFAEKQRINSILSPELIEQLWNHYEARSVIKAFAKTKRSQIQRKITKGIK